MQKRLFVFMLMMISMIWKSGMVYAHMAGKEEGAVLKTKSENSQTSIPINPTNSIEEDEEDEEDEDESLKKNKNQYVTDLSNYSEKKHLDLVKKNQSIFFLVAHKRGILQSPPYSPPDFCDQ